MDELAKIFPIQSCAFTQLYNSVFTIHPSFLHKSKKYTLRNHYSIAIANTQRVNCKFYAALSVRSCACLSSLRDWDSKGVLRIGASITIGSQFLPNYVKAFSELCPGLDVRVTVDQSERLEQKILANELDCALIEGIAHDPNIVSEAYMEDHLSVICGTDKGWTQGQVISIEDFQRQRFLLREKGSGTREVFNRVVEQAGIHITPVWEAMSTTALVNAAINGLGIAVLPHRMILPALRQGLICTVKVEGLSFSRNFHIIHHKDKFLTTSAKRFITLCRDFETDYPLPCYNGLYE